MSTAVQLLSHLNAFVAGGVLMAFMVDRMYKREKNFDAHQVVSSVIPHIEQALAHLEHITMPCISPDIKESVKKTWTRIDAYVYIIKKKFEVEKVSTPFFNILNTRDDSDTESEILYDSDGNVHLRGEADDYDLN